MSEVKKEVTNVAEIDEVEQQENAANKIVCKALFLSAQESAKTHKIGVSILLYDSMDEKGQVKVALEQKMAGKTSYTISPVICTWFDPDEKKTDPAIFANVKKLLNKGGLCQVYAIISGNGDFRKIHNFLSDSEYETYKKLIG